MSSGGHLIHDNRVLYSYRCRIQPLRQYRHVQGRLQYNILLKRVYSIKILCFNLTHTETIIPALQIQFFILEN